MSEAIQTAVVEKELRKAVRVAHALCRALQMKGGGVDVYLLGAQLAEWQKIHDPHARAGFTLATLQNAEQFQAWAADVGEPRFPRRD